MVGGLGSAVAETMAEAGLGRPLRRIGLLDRYAHGASRPYLMREHGLDAAGLIEAVEEMLGTRLDIGEDELAADTSDETTADDGRVEDL